MHFRRMAAGLALALAACQALLDFEGAKTNTVFLEGGSVDSPTAATDAVTEPDAGLETDGAPPTDGAAADGPTVILDASAYRKVVLADLPIAYFPLDEPQGQTEVVNLVDGGHATVVGAVKLGTTGVAGGAAEFDGKFTTAINAGNNYQFVGDASFSLEAWARPIVVDGNDNWLVRRLNGNNGYAFYVDRAGVTARIQVLIGDTVSIYGPEATYALTGPADAGIDMGWMHLVATFDGKDLAIWRDGVLVVAEPVPYRASPTTASFVIGAGHLGQLDEVAVYDKVLADVRISAHIAARPPP